MIEHQSLIQVSEFKEALAEEDRIFSMVFSPQGPPPAADNPAGGVLRLQLDRQVLHSYVVRCTTLHCAF